MYKDEAGIHYCSHCGSSWKKAQRYLWWPIRIAWRKQRKTSKMRFGWHGWEIGSNGAYDRVFGWTLHLWIILIKFGALNYKFTNRYIPSCGWVPVDQADSLSRSKEAINDNS